MKTTNKQVLCSDLPNNLRGKNPNDYEFRHDGSLVRKDRWEHAFRRIAKILDMNQVDISIDDVVSEVGSMVKARNNSEFESFLYPTISQSITNLGQKLLNDQLIRDRAIIACANVCQTVTDSGMFDAHQQYASAHCRDEIMKLSTGISVGEDGEDVGSIDELTERMTRSLKI